MSLYIGDICGYPHLFENPYNKYNESGINVASMIKRYWAKVGCLTCKPMRFRSILDFFNLETVNEKFSLSQNKENGYRAALNTAKEVNLVKDYLHSIWGANGDLWPLERRECLD